jgi:hypothetical protein
LNGNLLFAGMEFGVWMTVDGGTHWIQLKGGIPTTQARDLHIQRREGDLVVGTFGRGAFILDDYSALRVLTPQSLTEEAHLYPLRDAYMFDVLSHLPAAWGNVTTPNPPYGAVFTYSIGRIDAGARLVLNVTDADGKQIRRLPIPSETGVSRIAWDLRGETPPSRQTTDAAGAGRGGRGAAVTTSAGDDQEPPPAGFGGRGGQQQGPPVPAGRYRAAIGKLDGDKFTPIGDGQAFQVVPLPR